MTVYPTVKGGNRDWTVNPDTDFVLLDAEDIIKKEGWELTAEWWPLEPGVYVNQVVKL